MAADVVESDEATSTVRTSDEPDLESTSDRTIVDLVGLGPFLSLGTYRYLEAHEPLPAQRHAGLLVIVLPIRGRFAFVLDDETVAVDPGTVLLIRPGVEYRTGVNAQTRGELLWLVARAPAAARESGDARIGVDECLRMLVADGSALWPSPGPGLDLLQRALRGEGAAHGDTADDRRFRDLRRYHLVAAAVVELLADLRRDGAGSGPIHPGIRRVERWIDEHLGDTIGVRELIAISEMSSTHFYQQFIVAFGTSPKDYVLRRKMESAERALRESDRSVTSIAHDLGFSSSQHFGTAFRRYVGMTPTAYRHDAAR